MNDQLALVAHHDYLPAGFDDVELIGSRPSDDFVQHSKSFNVSNGATEDSAAGLLRCEHLINPGAHTPMVGSREAD